MSIPKIHLSINLLKVQGVKRLTSKSGQDGLWIPLAESRISTQNRDGAPHKNGAVYLGLNLIPRDDDFGNCGYVVEPIRREEIEAGLKLPILGNGKVPKGYEPKPSTTDKADDDEFPF